MERTSSCNKIYIKPFVPPVCLFSFFCLFPSTDLPPSSSLNLFFCFHPALSGRRVIRYRGRRCVIRRRRKYIFVIRGKRKIIRRFRQRVRIRLLGRYRRIKRRRGRWRVRINRRWCRLRRRRKRWYFKRRRRWNRINRIRLTCRIGRRRVRVRYRRRRWLFRIKNVWRRIKRRTVRFIKYRGRVRLVRRVRRGYGCEEGGENTVKSGDTRKGFTAGVDADVSINLKTDKLSARFPSAIFVLE